METAPSSKRNRYVAIVSIVLVVVALVVWMVIRLSAPSFDLTIASTAGGSVTTPGEAGPYNYDEGTVVNLVAEAEDEYEFVNWTGNVSTITDVNAAATTITMNGDYSITANFVKQYDLTTSSTAGGSVIIPGEGTFTYDEGAVVNLAAEAEEGYHFVNWTGDVITIADVNDATTTITMNGNYSITANLEVIPPVQYNLTISSTAGGVVTTPGEGTFAYDEGTVVNLVATPDAYYHFANWTGDVGTIDNVEATATTITLNGDYSITANFGVNPMVAAGYSHTVGLKTDGTVVAVGDETFGRCNVDGWTDIVQVAAGGYHTVGVKSDGTVVAVGRETAGQLNVGGWTDIVQVAAGEYYTVGLKSDGTVVAVGANGAGQCDVDGWTDIVQIAAGEAHTLGLKSDGSVVTAGDNSYLQRNIGWTNVVQVAAGRWHTLVLGADGTVHAIGYNDFHQCDVYSWTDITQVDGGGYHTVGLKSDDTVVVMGRSNYLQDDVDDWTDIVQVDAGEWHTVGLKSDGTVVAVGYVIGDVSGWDLD
jgi:ribosomal protein L27